MHTARLYMQLKYGFGPNMEKERMSERISRQDGQLFVDWDAVQQQL